MACLAGAIIVYLTLSIDFEVFMRYVQHSPTSWVVDFSEYALVFLTFLGGAWVLANEGHIKVEILVDRLPPGVHQKVNIVTSILGAVAFGLLFWYSLVLTLDAFAAKAVFIRPVVVPIGPMYSVIPIGSLFVALQFVRRGWLYATGRKVPEE